MNTICLVPDSTTNFAITALKNAYDKCNYKAARDAILSAFNALNLLHYDLDMERCHEDGSDSDGSFDAIEYCAAV